MADMRIRISFFERQFFCEDSTRTTIRGYEPAVINTPEGKVTGRVIIPEEMEKAQTMDFRLFQVDLPLINQNIQLDSIFSGNDNAKEWFEGLKQYYIDTHGEKINEELLIDIQHIGHNWTYHLLPDDYFERIKGGNRSYHGVEGTVLSIPEAVYSIIHPPIKFISGEWIPNLYYQRKATMSDGSKWSYSLRNPRNESHRNAPGVILGNLDKEDFICNTGGSEARFPINNFLDVCYPVGMREIGSKNPRSITFELVKI